MRWFAALLLALTPVAAAQTPPVGDPAAQAPEAGDAAAQSALPDNYALLARPLPRAGIAMEVGFETSAPLVPLITGRPVFESELSPTSRLVFPQVHGALLVGLSDDTALALKAVAATGGTQSGVSVGVRRLGDKALALGMPAAMTAQLGLMPRQPWNVPWVYPPEIGPDLFTETLSTRVLALHLGVLAPLAELKGKPFYFQGDLDLSADAVATVIYHADGLSTSAWRARPVGVSGGAFLGLGLPFKTHSMARVELGWRQDVGYLGTSGAYKVGVLALHLKMGGVSFNTSKPATIVLPEVQ